MSEEEDVLSPAEVELAKTIHRAMIAALDEGVSGHTVCGLCLSHAVALMQHSLSKLPPPARIKEARGMVAMFTDMVNGYIEAEIAELKKLKVVFPPEAVEQITLKLREQGKSDPEILEFIRSCEAQIREEIENGFPNAVPADDESLPKEVREAMSKESTFTTRLN